MDENKGDLLKVADPQRWERYGLAGFLVVVLMFWAKPILEAVATDCREFIKATRVTQEKQSDLLSTGNMRLEQIEKTTSESERILRDMHVRVLSADSK